MQLFKNTNIDFMGKKPLYLLISGAMVLVAIATTIIHRGPVLGIDFTGGTFLQLDFKELPPLEDVRSTLNDDGWSGFTLQSQPVNHSVIIRVKSGDHSNQDIANRIVELFVSKYPGNVNEVPERIEFVGPVVGHKLVKNTLMAIFGSLAVIILYVTIRFGNWVWGFFGVVALAHDVFLTVGFLTLMNVELTVVVIAALLTLAGYSINDTIVIFDRIRENMRTSRKENLTQIFNRSLNETLGRTINTSLTTFLAAISLQIFGGEVIHDFALAMTFGILVGTYSTIGVATALVHTIQSPKRKKS